MTRARGRNFTLTTGYGDIDLLGEMVGLGGFAAAVAAAVPVAALGQTLMVLDLDGREAAQRAGGSFRDILDLAEIAEIRRLRAAAAKE